MKNVLLAFFKIVYLSHNMINIAHLMKTNPQKIQAFCKLTPSYLAFFTL